MSQNSQDSSTQRIAISTDGVEIDSSQGDLLAEAILLGTIVIVVAVLYVGKKWIDRKFK
jgi:hypothetical protein